ncbi:response regulator [Dolichospermum sp. UHCC 0259]|uniref:response regulator n=1 Tax=Dolichospermum sp. UHCC 0259 TaxID=2590010 RepID=UPI001444C43F|nr:response regulator [Dolichospermum sp. UHCC 0259]MTJ50209.1 response regulator [Dolichospermum sp. UHCC 0259]
MDLDVLLSKFEECIQFQYNGNLDFNDTWGNKWTFYYHLGQIIWATGGIHPRRRWLRNIALICPHLDIDQFLLREEEMLIDYWDYLLLENLYHKKELNQTQFNDFVVKTVEEQLFDLVLAQQVNVSNLSWELKQDTILKTILSSTNTNIFIQEVKKSWDDWSSAGLSSLSPHLSPVLRQPEKLKQQVSTIVYKNFERLINGQHTLWDLAAKMQISIVSITKSLRPFIDKGIAEFIEVPDVQLLTKKVQQNSQSKSVRQNNSPLIVCIDDSLQVTKILENIVTSQGMKFIGIQDPLEALSILIENKPDLIFLDLMMPVVNGYQVCEQLRRISIFSQVPIVILTSSDGAFDRVRVKVFGATDFINKPIKKEQIFTILNKYLPTSSKTEYFPNFALSY